MRFPVCVKLQVHTQYEVRAVMCVPELLWLYIQFHGSSTTLRSISQNDLYITPARSGELLTTTLVEYDRLPNFAWGKADQGLSTGRRGDLRLSLKLTFACVVQVL